MDVVCFDDLDLGGRELDDPLAELEQDLYHVMLETPGSNLDDLDRGVGLRDRMSGAEDSRLTSQIEAGLSRDPRVTAVKAMQTALEDGTRALDVEVQANGTTLKIDLDKAQQEGRIL